MYRVLSKSENGNVGIEIERKLTEDDYELLIPYLDRIGQEVRSLSLLCDMTECDGLNSQVLWENLSRQPQQLCEMSLIAVLGDPQWIGCGTEVFHPILKPRVKFFLPDQQE